MQNSSKRNYMGYCKAYDKNHAKYIKYQQVHSNKPTSDAGSPSCRPGSVQLNLQKNMKRQTDPYGKAMKK